MTLMLTPELEAVLDQTVREGRFATREEAAAAAISALDPEASLPEAERARRAAIRAKNLVELFHESPFAGLDIEFLRDQSPWREVDF